MNSKVIIIALIVLIAILMVFSAVYMITKENKEKAGTKPGINISPPLENYTKSNMPEIYDKPDTYKISVSGVITRKMWFATVNVNVNALGQVDNKNHKMQVDMNISIPLVGVENSSMYLLEDTLYTKKSGLWVKKELNEDEKKDMWNRYDFIKRETGFINSSDSEVTGNETLEGADLLILKVTPDEKVLKDYVTSWLKQLSAAGLEKYMGSVSASDMEFNNTVFNYWIAKDTHLIKKEYVRSDIVIAGEGYSMQISAEIYDYDKPVNIALPDEALNARSA